MNPRIKKSAIGTFDTSSPCIDARRSKVPLSRGHRSIFTFCRRLRHNFSHLPPPWTCLGSSTNRHESIRFSTNIPPIQKMKYRIAFFDLLSFQSIEKLCIISCSSQDFQFKNREEEIGYFLSYFRIRIDRVRRWRDSGWRVPAFLLVDMLRATNYLWIYREQNRAAKWLMILSFGDRFVPSLFSPEKQTTPRLSPFPRPFTAFSRSPTLVVASIRDK